MTLRIASQYGNHVDVQALIAAGADVNATNNEGYIALMYASSNGHNKVVKALLAAGAK